MCILQDFSVDQKKEGKRIDKSALLCSSFFKVEKFRCDPSVELLVQQSHKPTPKAEVEPLENQQNYSYA